ncbi:MAG TPA: hypothetical protein VIN08_07030 [Ohtaekwangia sp.]|uniref:hypothetical protein n=1 Tax=Ohtaekwangia sp. TaxID=2066019 RepID=UPI002F955318
MRKFILCAIVFVVVWSCTTRKEQSEAGAVSQDTIHSDSAGIREAAVAVNFPLDSLLSFQSEEALKNIFGANVKRSTGYYPEGMGEYQNTLLFPGTRNEVEFVWEDDTVAFKGLAYIQVDGEQTDWKTKEGITLGTRLKELEKLNQKPFTFSGFGWDYGGIASWDDGHLEARKITVGLEYPDETMPQEFDDLLGDHDIKSNSDLAQKANPVVVRITMNPL